MRTNRLSGVNDPAESTVGPLRVTPLSKVFATCKKIIVLIFYIDLTAQCKMPRILTPQFQHCQNFVSAVSTSPKLCLRGINIVKILSPGCQHRQNFVSAVSTSPKFCLRGVNIVKILSPECQHRQTVFSRVPTLSKFCLHSVNIAKILSLWVNIVKILSMRCQHCQNFISVVTTSLKFCLCGVTIVKILSPQCEQPKICLRGVNIVKILSPQCQHHQNFVSGMSTSSKFCLCGVNIAKILFLLCQHRRRVWLPAVSDGECLGTFTDIIEKFCLRGVNIAEILSLWVSTSSKFCLRGVNIAEEFDSVRFQMAIVSVHLPTLLKISGWKSNAWSVFICRCQMSEKSREIVPCYLLTCQYVPFQLAHLFVEGSEKKKWVICSANNGTPTWCKYYTISVNYPTASE
jgi:hypothetical protein